MPASVTFLFTSLCLGQALRLKDGVSAAGDALQAIVLNTPKCGTGSLQKMFMDLMHCPQQEKELGLGYVLKSCPGTRSWVYRSHGVNESVAYFEKHPELKFGGNHGRCAVLSSFRNPASWLKSLYFEGRKQELCDGVDDVAGVISDFEEYLLHRFDISAFKAGAVAALFGLNDFPALMKQTAKGGGFYHLPANSFPQGPFGQCELFFLQVEEMGDSHEHFLAQWPGIRPMQHETTDFLCPKSQNIRDALKAHVIRPESMSRLFSKNPFLEQAWNFYGLK